MKIIKELSYRCLIILVMLSLTFVAYDMSEPVLLSQKNISAEDVVECIMQPLSKFIDDEQEEIAEIPSQNLSFTWNMLLPIIIYLISIGGFLYLLIEDFKMIKTFAKKNKIAKVLWCLWIVILIGMILIPIFFGFQMLMKGFVLAVIATFIFLILIGILYALSIKSKKKKRP